MKIGMSSYCLTPTMANGSKSVYDVIDWAADHGCEHIEFVPFYLPFVDEEKMCLNEELIDSVVAKCAERGLEISTYSVGADFLVESDEERKLQIERVKLHIDAAARLGIKLMRHDIAGWNRTPEQNTPENFYRELPIMAACARECYDYAAKYGITTTIENHGVFCNGSDRLVRLIQEIDRPGISMTLDIGNFLCVDEFPFAAVQKCIKYAKVIHFKDFYIRKREQLPDCNVGGWLTSRGGQALRGSIVGQGDIDIWQIARIIKDSGYDGYISVEFEGMEESELGTSISLDMARAILAQA